MFEELTSLTKENFFQQYEKVLPKMSELFSDPFIRYEASTKQCLKLYEDIKKEQNTATTKPFNTLSNKIFYTWLKLLDNEIAIEEKNQWCQQLMNIDKNIARLIMKQPTIIIIHFLAYSNHQAIYSCFDSQFKYRLSDEWQIDYFQTPVNLMVHSTTIATEFKTIFFDNIFLFLDELEKKQKALSWVSHFGNTEQAMACWLYHDKYPTQTSYLKLKHALPAEHIPTLDEVYNQAMTFKDLVPTLSETDSLRVEERDHQTLYALKMCFEESDLQFSKQLTSIVQHISNEKKLAVFIDMMQKANKAPNQLLQFYALMVAEKEYKLENCPELFFSTVLPYLKDNLPSTELELLNQRLSEKLNAHMFIRNIKYFKESAMLNDILLYWALALDSRLAESIQLGLSYGLKQEEYHASAKTLVSEIGKHKKSAQILALLHASLSSIHLMGVFSLSNPKTQSDIFKVICSEIQSVPKLLLVDLAISKSLYPTKAQEAFAKLLEDNYSHVNPDLLQQIKQAGLFGLTHANPVLRDLTSLKNILSKQHLSFNEQISEIHELHALTAALKDKTMRHETLLEMFYVIDQDKWPQLFIMYNNVIIHWNLPHIKDPNMPEKLKKQLDFSPQKTWLDDLDKWQEILTLTLQSISKNQFEHQSILSSIGNRSLGYIQEALARTNLHIENFSFNLFKEKLTHKIESLIPLLLKMKSDSIDKYDNHKKYVVDDAMIASMLPDKLELRIHLLNQLFQSNSSKIRHLEHFAKYPFVRNEAEQSYLIKTIYYDKRDIPIIFMLSPFLHDLREKVVFILFKEYPEEMKVKFLESIDYMFTRFRHDPKFCLEHIIQLLKDVTSQGCDPKTFIKGSPYQEFIFQLIESHPQYFEDNYALFVSLHRSLTDSNFYYHIFDKMYDEHQRRFCYYGFAELIKEINEIERGLSFSDFIQQNVEVKSSLIDLIERNISAFIDHYSNSLELLSFIKTFMPNINKKIICAMDKFVEYHTDDEDDQLNQYDAEKLHNCISDLISVFGRHAIQSECRAYPRLEITLQGVLATSSSNTLQESTDVMFPVLPNNFGSQNDAEDHSVSPVLTSAAK